MSKGISAGWRGGGWSSTPRSARTAVWESEPCALWCGCCTARLTVRPWLLRPASLTGCGLTLRKARRLATGDRAAKNRRADPTTETELLARARMGDVQAFERLAAVHTDHLYTVVLRLVSDREEAEDVVQEALLRAWRGIGRFQGRSLFFTWLYRIAVNEANRALERRSRTGTSVQAEEQAVQLPAPAHLEPAHQAERHDLQDALERAIGGLAPAYRTALVLRDIEGLSTREAAKIAGVGEAAFKSRLHQARLKVRSALGDDTLVAAAP